MKRIQSWFRAAVIRGTPQIALFSIGITLWAVDLSYAREKRRLNQETLPLLERFQPLNKKGAISGDDIDAVVRMFVQVNYPESGGSWLLKHASSTGSMMVIFSMLLLTWSKRLEAEVADRVEAN